MCAADVTRKIKCLAKADVGQRLAEKTHVCLKVKVQTGKERKIGVRRVLSGLQFMYF